VSCSDVERANGQICKNWMAKEPLGRGGIGGMMET